MKLSKQLTTVTPLSKTLAAILFVSMPIISFFLGMKVQSSLEELNKTKVNTDQSISKTSNNSAQDYRYEIEEMKVENPSYSFLYPKPQHCNGCYDGLGGAPDGYASAEIKSQANDYGQADKDEWLIQYTTIKDGVPLPDSDFNIINNSFFKQLSAIKLDQVATIVDSKDHQSYLFKHLEDKKIDGVNAQIYESNYKNSINSDAGITRYAVFKKDNYQYLLAVTFADPGNHKVFDIVTASFKFSLPPTSKLEPTFPPLVRNVVPSPYFELKEGTAIFTDPNLPGFGFAYPATWMLQQKKSNEPNTLGFKSTYFPGDNIWGVRLKNNSASVDFIFDGIYDDNLYECSNTVEFNRINNDWYRIKDSEGYFYKRSTAVNVETMATASFFGTVTDEWSVVAGTKYKICIQGFGNIFKNLNFVQSNDPQSSSAMMVENPVIHGNPDADTLQKIDQIVMSIKGLRD